MGALALLLGGQQMVPISAKVPSGLAFTTTRADDPVWQSYEEPSWWGWNVSEPTPVGASGAIPAGLHWDDPDEAIPVRNGERRMETSNSNSN